MQRKTEVKYARFCACALSHSSALTRLSAVSTFMERVLFEVKASLAALSSLKGDAPFSS